MSSVDKIDYYETLELTKKASQQEIKQAYKRLALIHHPDKNQGAQHAKIKFRQISQAYSVLNDPKKRQNYDKYGVADLEGLDFEQFMSSFGEFEDFLTEILSFNTFDAMFTGMNKRSTKKGASKTRGRAKGRNKNMSSAEMNQFAKLLMGGGIESSIEMAMMEAFLDGEMYNEADIKQMEKELQKMILKSDDEDEDEQDLTEQQMRILDFGQKNIQKKKVGKKKKKTEIKCKFDGEVIEQDEILMHFSQKHMAQFKKWQQQNSKSNPTTNNESKNQQKKQEQQIQY